MIKDKAAVKVDSVENWNKAKNYIPNSFTILVYEYEDRPPKIKLGDGIHKVSELPFLVTREVEDDILIL